MDKRFGWRDCVLKNGGKIDKRLLLCIAKKCEWSRRCGMGKGLGEVPSG